MPRRQVVDVIYPYKFMTFIKTAGSGKSPEIITLALSTLGSFDFSGNSFLMLLCDWATDVIM
jgi:hypothetical protein